MVVSTEQQFCDPAGENSLSMGYGVWWYGVWGMVVWDMLIYI